MVTADGFDRSLLLDRRTSNPTLPSGVDTFSPPVDSEVHPVAGSPMIAASNLDGQPDDTLTITGSKLTNYSPGAADAFSDTRLIIYGQTGETGTFADASIQDTGNALASGVLATIPTSLPSDSMYLVWPVNAMGVGSPVAINRTDAQWMLPSPATTVYEDTTVSVYGRNLANASGDSWVYLQPDGSTSAGEWMNGGDPITGSNPYRVQFTPSDDLATGNYDVWVYNGMGGAYGWSEAPGVINYGGPPPSTTDSVVTVSAYGATGDGTTDDGPAIRAALSDTFPGEVLYFPGGTYLVNNNAEQSLLLDGSDSATFQLSYDGHTSDTLTLSSVSEGDIQTQISDLLSAAYPGGTEEATVSAASNGATYKFDFSNFTNTLPISVVNVVTPPGSTDVIAMWGTGQILVPSGVEILGAGMGASTIEFNGNLPNDQDYGGFDIGAEDDRYPFTNNITFESIGLTYNGPQTGQDGAVIRERRATGMTLDNVEINAGGQAAVDWEQSEGVQGSDLAITNSTIISCNTYINGCNNVVLDHDIFLQAGAAQLAAVDIFSCTQVSMTNCTTENELDTLPTDEVSGMTDDEKRAYAGEGKFVEFGYETTDVYCADNTSTNLGEYVPAADLNSGEQLLVDGGINSSYGSSAVADEQVISADANSVAVPAFSLAPGTDWSSYYLDVTSGPNMGERFPIISGVTSGETTTVTINGAFATTPDNGDYVNVDEGPSNLVFYQNNLNHTTNYDADLDTASTGINVASGYGVVIDGNTVNDTLYGVRIYSTNDSAPSAFSEVINNTFNLVQTGAGLPPAGVSLISDNNVFHLRPDPDFYGVEVDHNSMNYSGSFTIPAIGIAMETSENGVVLPVVKTFSTFEQNTINGFSIGIEADNSPGSFAYQNIFTLGSGSVGINFGSSPSNLLLLGNTFSGVSSDYSGTPASSSLEVPQTVFYMAYSGGACAPQTLLLNDDGTSEVAWSASVTSINGNPESWLTVEDSTGTILPDSSTPSSGTGSIQLVADPTGLAAGNYFALVTITSPSTGISRAVSVEFVVS